MSKLSSVLNRVICAWANLEGKWMLTIFLMLFVACGMFYVKTVERLDEMHKIMNQSKEILDSFRVSPPRARLQ